MVDGTIRPPSDIPVAPGFRTRLGEPIVAGERYAVTPDGLPHLDAADLMFIAPEHQWRIEWAPEYTARVQLTREDYTSFSSARLAPLGLLGLAVYATHGRFRTVSLDQFRAAASEVTAEMARYQPETRAVVDVPQGFTFYTISPSMVVGSVAAHRQALLEQTGTAR